MAPSTDQRWRDLAVGVIDGYVTAADPADYAAAARRAFQDLDGVVSTLMGHAGLNALTDRALYLARRESRGMVAEPIATHTDDGLIGVAEGVAALPAAQARDGAVAILAAFAGLLATFVGDGLALQLLRQAWPNVPSLPGAEEDSQ
ncbi:MAG TPA: hypothetical protein VN515_06555 [Terriglobales bacterium]|nr:hypothetical protein [Terriglobales bacterium]